MKNYLLFLTLGVTCVCSQISAQTVKLLSLREAVSIAVEHNPQTHIGRRRIDAQRGQYWRSLALPPPSISVNYAFIPVGAGLDQFSERTIEFAQAFDFPTTIALRGSLASSEFRVAQIEYSATELETIAQVKRAYHRVLAKQQKLFLAKEYLTLAEDFAAKSSARRKAGEGTHLEQLTASVQRSQAHNAVESATNEFRIAKDELELILGERDGPIQHEHILTDSMTYSPETNTLEQYFAMAKASNTQLRTNDLRRDIASTGYSLAWSALLPSFSASYFRQKRDGVSGLYGVSLGMSVPLWFMFDQRGQIQTASAEVSIAERQSRFSQDSVLIVVRSSYYEKLNSERQLRLYRTEILPESDEILRVAKASYAVGEITYLEFLQAQQATLQARSTYIDVLLSYNVACTRLEQIVGTPHESSL
ncbi:MAG: TolC family protein [Ignavibacteriales bacterium]|nr:TolC family protein [Ignavibacteriales bacterium]